ncbi:ribonucleoside triphosphate reductase [Seleniivibrio sp.]|uniref:ribonucleoside triphosphate reductase n=1 Tax=Seleniivibrio sp. TaxID=2898801 RepID=UPI0025E02D32|nr:ribonucleoside triphosphate reductase [Seleniivibrio sp.]MCD8553850.1 ribonucleoside triphosphate reductase [Seleniivibrio sp.]
MIEKVSKRDGRFVSFDAERIANAIYKAAKAVGGTDRNTSSALSIKVCRNITDKYGNYGTVSVEEIQDEVEKVLIEQGHAKTAKAYILYRKQRAEMRDIKEAFGGLESIVEEYLGGSDWRVNENSNTTYALQGLNNYISSKITAKYWLNKIYPQNVQEAHVNGEYHIHDLGLLAVYCCGWDLKDLLTRGFGGVHGKVESKPPKHLRSAMGQIVNFFYTLQGEAAGAQAFSNFDTLLAPFIAYDNLSYNEVKQAMQEFIFNLNVPTRVGFQTPFTNLTMDLYVPKAFRDEAVVIGGVPQERTYGEFQEELFMFNRAFIEVMQEGDAKGRVFTFPIPTYNVDKDFDWSNPIVTDLMKITAKYGTPYFANFVNSDMSPDDARSMCCRLRLDNRELRKRGGGLFGANPLTGSIGVVTINLPRIGYTAGNEAEFFSKLSNLMELAREGLKIKRKSLEKLTSNGLYPYSKYYLSDIYERNGQYWKNHFNTIGIIGMNECLLNFLGVDIMNPQGLEFSVKVLNFMRDKLADFQDEDDMLYNLEATPAEGTSYRLAKKDFADFGDIVTSGSAQRPYYTNSTQLPVEQTRDLFKALSHQDKLQPLYTGGTVFHVFLGEAVDRPETVSKLLENITQSYAMPYITITPTFSVCPVHGYIKGEHKECPLCEDERKHEISLQIERLKNQIEQEVSNG